MNEKNTDYISSDDSINIAVELTLDRSSDHFAYKKDASFNSTTLNDLIVCAINNDDADFFKQALNLGYPGLFRNVNTITYSGDFEIKSIADIHDRVIKYGAISIFKLLHERGAFENSDYMELACQVSAGLKSYNQSVSSSLAKDEEYETKLRNYKSLFDIVTSKDISFNDIIHCHSGNSLEVKINNEVFISHIIRNTPMLFKTMIENCAGDINKSVINKAMGQTLTILTGLPSETLEILPLEEIFFQCSCAKDRNVTAKTALNSRKYKVEYSSIIEMLLTSIDAGAELRQGRELRTVQNQIGGTEWELLYHSSVAAKKLNDKANSVTAIKASTPVRRLAL